MKTFEEFMTSLEAQAPPEGMSGPVLALWVDHQGNWDQAHSIVQEIASQEASWVHAYLHRKEGDLGNAGYWYRRAGKKPPSGSLEQEWTDLVKALLTR